MAKSVIPVFFAVDENYIPYLSVTVASIKRNINAGNNYKLHILHSGVSEEKLKPILNFESENFSVSFIDISSKLSEISKKLNLRDYYTQTTYFRIFIAGLFPEYDKAIYLDSDTVVLTDIAEFYNIDLEGNIVAGIPDGAVACIKPFQDYVNKVLGIEYEKYFNAGIMLMDLKKFREIDFYALFTSLLGKYKFRVAQDQDYLNVLCYGKVKLLPSEWNVMPIIGKEIKGYIEPKIIHFNLTSKPWHYKGLQFEEYFWEYAKDTPFNDFMLSERDNFTDDKKHNDELCEKGLIQMCISESESEDNYYNLYINPKKNIG